MPQANSITSRPRVTSPSASESTLPCSAREDARDLLAVLVRRARGSRTGARRASRARARARRGTPPSRPRPPRRPPRPTRSRPRRSARRWPGCRRGRCGPTSPATSSPPIQWLIARESRARSRPARSRARSWLLLECVRGSVSRGVRQRQTTILPRPLPGRAASSSRRTRSTSSRSRRRARGRRAAGMLAQARPAGRRSRRSRRPRAACRGSRPRSASRSGPPTGRAARSARPAPRRDGPLERLAAERVEDVGRLAEVAVQATASSAPSCERPLEPRPGRGRRRRRAPAPSSFAAWTATWPAAPVAPSTSTRSSGPDRRPPRDRHPARQPRDPERRGERRIRSVRHLGDDRPGLRPLRHRRRSGLSAEAAAERPDDAAAAARGRRTRSPARTAAADGRRRTAPRPRPGRAGSAARRAPRASLPSGSGASPTCGGRPSSVISAAARER